MQPSKTHWPSILILIAIALGVLGLATASMATAVASLVGLFDEFTDAAGTMIQSAAFGFEACLLLVCAWFIFQKTMGREAAERIVQFPFSIWHIFIYLPAILFVLGFGALITITEIKWLAWLTLPILTIGSVCLPIALILGVGSRGMNFGARWKAWGTVAISMSISPILMVTIELMILAAIVIIWAIYLSIQPGMVERFNELVFALDQNLNEEAALSLLAPYLSRPGTIASIFLYLSLFVPLVEEFIKPLAVWLFARKMKSAGDGLSLGLLCGGVFALIESLNVGGNGGTAWSVIVGVRIGTSLLHITASGLMGVAIVQLFHQKKVARFLLTYAAVVLLHGLWNACAAGTAMATLGEFIDRPQWIWYMPAALGGFVILFGGMSLILIAANRRLVDAQAQPAGAETQRSG
ncbi:MAG: PrsW family intramembrane metalloprotease [Chloroflexi bacterium]|nr:PrsW family intramembrane metalloprotease [Chloroflexota bacterium]